MDSKWSEKEHGPLFPRRDDWEIDAALELVDGSFQVAAKLLDMEPRQLRNRVGRSPELKARWGKPVGRPPERIGFEIWPFEPGDLFQRRRMQFLDRGIVVMLRALEREAVIAALRPLYQAKQSQPATPSQAA